MIKVIKTIFYTINIFIIFGCSNKFLNNNKSCSPYSEYKSYEINGKVYEFNLVEGKSNPHLDNDNNSFFFNTDFDEPFIKDYLKELKFTKRDKLQLYNLELFITKPKDTNASIIDGELVSVIAHFKDEKKYLHVRYFEIQNDILQEVEELRSVVPYISASASYLNFLFLKESGFLTNNFIFYNQANHSFRRAEKESFDISLVNFKRENGNLPLKYIDIEN